MTAAAVTVPRVWAGLTASERRAGAEALAVAVDEGVSVGGDRNALAIAAGANTHKLLLTPAGWRLLIETPRYANRANVPTTRNLERLDPDDEWTAPVDEPMPLADALRALVDPNAGPAELERRRAELEDRRRREGEQRAERARVERESLEQVQRWNAEHAEQLAAWGRLPRAAQIYLKAAADHPHDVAAALRAVARMTMQSERISIPMPADFDPGVLEG